jgi:hypothetical protein
MHAAVEFLARVIVLATSSEVPIFQLSSNSVVPLENA